MKNYNELTNSEKELYGFEYFCNACDNFGTDKCPFKDIATPETLWRKEDEGGLGCENFWD